MFCMSETPVTPAIEKPWRDMSDEELALSLVNFKLEGLKSSIEGTRHSLTEVRESKLKFASDENSDTGEEFPEMEDEQFDDEKAGKIKNLEEALSDFIDEYDVWDEDLDIIKEGGEDAAQIIKAHSASEKVRREELEKVK